MPSDPSGRQMAGFKPFYQFISPTRVIAGHDLIGGTGFEFAKEGARRPLIVTDQGIRATGLVDRVENGVIDGGLEVAGIFDGVPQDSDSDVVVRVAELAHELGADSILAVGGGSVMDTAKVANVIFVHGSTPATGRATTACRGPTTARAVRSSSPPSPASRPPPAPARRPASSP